MAFAWNVKESMKLNGALENHEAFLAALETHKLKQGQSDVKARLKRFTSCTRFWRWLELALNAPNVDVARDVFKRKAKEDLGLNNHSTRTKKQKMQVPSAYN